MDISQKTIKKALFLLGSLLIILALLFNLQNLNASKNANESVSMNNNFQYINILAKNGYTPNTITAKANIPSIIRIETDNTFDCSAAISIPKLNYSKFLPTTGISEVQLLPQEAGTKILGSCSMGMYGFEINFV